MTRTSLLRPLETAVLAGVFVLAFRFPGALGGWLEPAMALLFPLLLLEALFRGRHAAWTTWRKVQFAVIESLAKIRDESSVSALIGALSKSSDLVASMIVDTLGEIGNIKAALAKGADLVLKTAGGKSVSLKYSLSARQRDILLAGGMLNYTRAQSR